MLVVSPTVASTAPWPKQASPWDKAVPKPEVYFGQIDPDAEDNAVLWYRPRDDATAEKEKASRGAATITKPEELGWKSIRPEGVRAYPHRINPLSELPDGRLYGTGDDYVGTFIFDPKTDRTTDCGPRTGLARKIEPVGSPTFVGNDLYFSGSEQLRRIRNLVKHSPATKAAN